VQHYGIRATWEYRCYGRWALPSALEIMDLEPRTFTIREIKFLELIARWSMSEFERNRLLKAQDTQRSCRPQKYLAESLEVRIIPTISPTDPLSTIQIKLELLAQLTQELRTPDVCSGDGWC